MSLSTDRSWLHPSLTGVQAEQLLNNEGKVGSFLIRPSQSGISSYSLSVRLPDSVTHIRINNDGDCYDVHGSGGDTFASLSDLVRWYMESSGGLGTLKEKNGNVIEMRYPLPTSDHSNERFFHRNLSGPEAESLLEPFKAGWFLVRESQKMKGNFVISVRTDSEQMHCMHVFITFKNGKYSIGDDFNFNSLAQLVYHYRSHSIVDRSGVTVKLKQAVDMTQFHISDIGVRVAQLEKVFEVNGETRDGFWEEFEHLQSQEDTYSQQFDAGKLAENRKKNRYKNILPFEHSRVKLREVDPETRGSDYINANYVMVGGDGIPVRASPKRRYIAAQGCIQNTVADFWQMIWQENCSIIVMLTQLKEGGKMKCAQYWPNEGEGALTLPVYNANITIELISCTEETPDLLLRVLKMSKTSNKGKRSSSRTVYQYHFIEWPDKKVPTAADAGTALTLLEKVNGRWLADNFAGPLVVHCSAGIGRTGTYIAIDILLQELQAADGQCEIDVSKTIQLLRQYRPGFVQVWHQYRFIYIAIKQFTENRSSVAVARNVSSNNSELYANVGAPPAAGMSGMSATRKSSKPPPAPIKPSANSGSNHQVAQFGAKNSQSSHGHQVAESGLHNIYENMSETVSQLPPVKRH